MNGEEANAEATERVTMEGRAVWSITPPPAVKKNISGFRTVTSLGNP